MTETDYAILDAMYDYMATKETFFYNQIKKYDEGTNDYKWKGITIEKIFGIPKQTVSDAITKKCTESKITLTEISHAFNFLKTRKGIKACDTAKDSITKEDAETLSDFFDVLFFEKTKQAIGKDVAQRILNPNGLNDARYILARQIIINHNVGIEFKRAFVTVLTIETLNITLRKFLSENPIPKKIRLVVDASIANDAVKIISIILNQINVTQPTEIKLFIPNYTVFAEIIAWQIDETWDGFVSVDSQHFDKLSDIGKELVAIEMASDSEYFEKWTLPSGVRTFHF